MNPTGINISYYVQDMAQKAPYKKAVIAPFSRDAQGRVAYTHLTYQQLDQECDRLAHGFTKAGFKRNMRVLLMVRPSLEYVALTFALFKMGTIPVLIDPGMGVRRMLRCIEESAPEGFVGIPKAHLFKKLFPRSFRSLRFSVLVGKKSFWNSALTLETLRNTSEIKPFPPAETQGHDTAGIFFTSGSTGIPKGVEYFHSQMDAQVRFLKQHYQVQPDEVDLPTFPLFLLFCPAFGVTCVIPDMDPTKPAQVQPERIIEAIQDHGVTHSFGSPALWNRVSKYCIEHQIQLPSLKRILIAGAPVPGSVLKRFEYILPHGEAFTPYGATEALPLCSLGSKEICSETLAFSAQGRGTCVGKPFEELTLKVIKISEEVYPQWSPDLEVPQGEVGEITVKGPVVTKTYLHREKETQEAKIYEGEEVWHRMGDLGYFDEQGRLWFCGRKRHRVQTPTQTYFSVQVEGIFDAEADIWRTALVGVPDKTGVQQLVLCIEFQPGQTPKDRSKRRKELHALAQKYQIPLEIFLFYPGIFPVDRRHNAKIERESLALWAKLWIDSGKER
jgi:acyl-CoA synthetase (AMP-forming)/AMP-acid ligase II